MRQKSYGGKYFTKGSLKLKICLPWVNFSEFCESNLSLIVNNALTLSNCSIFGLQEKKCKQIYVHRLVHKFVFLKWKFFQPCKLQLQVFFFLARVEFPSGCREKRHRTLRECYRRNILTGSGVSCCRSTLLGHSVQPFSVLLLSLLGLDQLTWLPGGVTEGGQFALLRMSHCASLTRGPCSS